jgi:hypothetical protein
MAIRRVDGRIEREISPEAETDPHAVFSAKADCITFSTFTLNVMFAYLFLGF